MFYLRLFAYSGVGFFCLSSSYDLCTHSFSGLSIFLLFLC